MATSLSEARLLLPLLGVTQFRHPEVGAARGGARTQLSSRDKRTAVQRRDTRGNAPLLVATALTSLAVSVTAPPPLTVA